MTNKDKKRFAACLAMMELNFSLEKTVSEEQQKLRAKLYFKFLEDLPIEVVEKAVEDLIKNRLKTYPAFPLVAEIREAVFGEQNTVDEDALEAWREAREIGYRVDQDQCLNTPDVKLTDREGMIQDAIKLAFGSWSGYWDVFNDSYERSHFLKCFHVVRRRYVTRNINLLAEGKQPLQLEGRKEES